MATTTAIQGLPVPQSTDTPDVPRDFLALANAVEKKLVMVFTTTAQRSSLVTSPTAGMVTVITSTETIDLYNGTTWKQIYPPTGQPNHSVGSTVPSNATGADGDVFFKV